MFLAHLLPRQIWVRAVFDSWAPDAQMQRAFDYAAKVRNQGWRTVLGPAGAVVLTLQRLEWQALSWDVWVNTDGVTIRIKEIGPRTVQALADETTRRLLRLRAGAHYNVSWGPYVEPLRAELARLGCLGDHLGVSLLIAQVSGGLWTQSDVFRKQFVTDD
eukprot:3333917-Pyramimonas_sp.AAC.1